MAGLLLVPEGQAELGWVWKRREQVQRKNVLLTLHFHSVSFRPHSRVLPRECQAGDVLKTSQLLSDSWALPQRHGFRPSHAPCCLLKGTAGRPPEEGRLGEGVTRGPAKARLSGKGRGEGWEQLSSIRRTEDTTDTALGCGVRIKQQPVWVRAGAESRIPVSAALLRPPGAPDALNFALLLQTCAVP